MTALPKKIRKIRTSANQTKYISFESYGHFCHILALFTMPTHQIWSCHVTQDANFEKFLFCPNSTFDIKKSQNLQWRSSLLQKLSEKPYGGGGGKQPPLPVPLGLKKFFNEGGRNGPCWDARGMSRIITFRKKDPEAT